MDSFTVAASLVATWMLARKLLEQWFVWFVVNVLYIYMYWVKGLHPTALLFVIYACGSVIGYITWLRHYRLQQGRLNA
jgi:nicotinamide mononucleotide transporter